MKFIGLPGFKTKERIRVLNTRLNPSEYCIALSPPAQKLRGKREQEQDCNALHPKGADTLRDLRTEVSPDDSSHGHYREELVVNGFEINVLASSHQGVE